MPDHRAGILAILTLSLVCLGLCSAQDAAPASSVILRLREGPDIAGASIWRCYEVWRTDVARREDGTLVDVDMLTPVMCKDDKGNLFPSGINKSAVNLCPARRVIGAPWPAEGWQQSEFDDGDWNRVRDLQRPTYRSTALSCLRGRFEVADPAKAGELALHLEFRGGAVAYLNGTEIGRSGMPDGKIAAGTLAKDYPKEAYVDTKGFLIAQPDNFWKVLTYLPAKAATTDAGKEKQRGPPNLFTNQEDIVRYQSRLRVLDAKIPAKLLRPGVNVLAVELHRAPAQSHGRP